MSHFLFLNPPNYLTQQVQKLIFLFLPMFLHLHYLLLQHFLYQLHLHHSLFCHPFLFRPLLLYPSPTLFHSFSYLAFYQLKLFFMFLHLFLVLEPYFEQGSIQLFFYVLYFFQFSVFAFINADRQLLDLLLEGLLSIVDLFFLA